MNKAIALVLVIFLSACDAAAAELAATERASITIRSLPDSARVTIDSAIAGWTPLTLDSLAAGLHRLRLIHPDMSNWLTVPLEDTVRLSPGEHRTLQYTFEQARFLVSLPSGAEVFIGDSVVGTTPLTFLPGQMPAGSPVKLRKNGFSPVRADFSLATRGVLTVALSPEGGMPVRTEEDLVPAPWSGRLVIPGALAVLSGGLTAYFKIKADNHQTAYLATGDLSQRAERDRLDNLAAVFLVAMQVSLGFFITFILTQ